MKLNSTTLAACFFFLVTNFIVNPVFSQNSHRVMSREAYLLEVKQAQEKGKVFEDAGIKISDLLFPNWREWYQRSPNPIMVPVGKFYSFNQERKVQILTHPTIYIIAPDEEFPLRVPISRQEYEALSPEKREALIQEFRLEIQD